MYRSSRWLQSKTAMTFYIDLKAGGLVTEQEEMEESEQVEEWVQMGEWGALGSRSCQRQDRWVCNFRRCSHMSHSSRWLPNKTARRWSNLHWLLLLRKLGLRQWQAYGVGVG
jgi:hypothetical protein